MDPKLIDRLRADLAAASYRVDAVTALLGAGAEEARLRGVFAPARRALAQRESSPLESLVRVLLLGEAIAVEEIDAALPSLGAAGAIELGLLTADDQFGASENFAVSQSPAGSQVSDSTSRLRAALSLNPVVVDDSAFDDPAEWWILSDLDDQLRRAPARPDHVMGIGGATRSLIALVPSGPLDRALDLGTGCGIVALHLARRVGSTGAVVATDISDRALCFAEANARLNGVDGIDFRKGNLFEPVDEERFDLILSNPPFVITPRGDKVQNHRRYEYRDGGLVGDALAEAVVRSGPAYLETGGQLLCLANWECPWGVDGLGRVRAWIDAAAKGIDEPVAAWVIERDRVLPEQYAETWARDGGARPGDAEFERLMDDWLVDFSARRVAAIGLGSIRVARAAQMAGRADAGRQTGADATVVRLERASGAWGAHPADPLQHAFETAMRCEAMTDSEMLSTHWQKDAAVGEERMYEPGMEAPSELTLLTERGIARRVSADPLLSAAVGACDGDLSLEQIADALATILEVDADAARDALVAGVRELAWLGMLRPSGEEPGFAR
ncbi:DUF7059 domain-containing protein [Leucobacter sp. GX24907]